METINVAPRPWISQRDRFAGAKVREFGLQDNVEAIVQVIQDRIDGYGETLKLRLSELGAEVVPAPAVPHLEIAQRASEQRAPYQGKDKDGYRDTLIWLTVLDVAAKNPSHEVWFVSENVTDFGDLSFKQKSSGNEESSATLPRPLHQELQKELESRGLQGRIKYVTSLQSLEQHLAALHGPIPASDLEILTSLLDFDSLEDLLNDQTSIVISPEDAALNPGTAQAVVNKLSTRGPGWTFSDAAGRGEDRWTANFAVDAEAEIFTFSADPANASSIVNKPLRVSGTAAFTKQGQPEEVQISRIEALPGDPNRGVWAVLTSIGFGQLDLMGTPNPGFANFIQAVKVAQGFTVPPDTLNGITQALTEAQGTIPTTNQTEETSDGDVSTDGAVSDGEEGPEEVDGGPTSDV